MIRCNGVHHLAVCTADIKSQIEFASDVLGLELVALYWMHGVQGAWHGFLKLHDHSYLAFVQTPEIAARGHAGLTHSGSPGAASAPGTMQHLAQRDSLRSWPCATASAPRRDRGRASTTAVRLDLLRGLGPVVEI
jgi:catechol 2,3-dioxygenase-like lactoylglutathione lyase family enzyme